MNNPYSIMAIANTMANDISNHGTHNHLQYIQWLTEEYRLLRFGTLRETKSVIIPLTNINTIELSQISDFVDYVKVGEQRGDKIWALTEDKEIATLHERDDCGNETPNDSGIGQTPYSKGLNLDLYTGLGFRNIQGYWGAIGACTSDYNQELNIWKAYYDPYLDNQKGHFKYDRELKRLQFASNFRQKYIFLEYVSDGMDACGETCIPPYSYKYLVAKGHYRRMEFDMNLPESLRQSQYRKVQVAKSELDVAMAGDMSARSIAKAFRNNTNMGTHS